MDKVLLLVDVVVYINQLKVKIINLELQINERMLNINIFNVVSDNQSMIMVLNCVDYLGKVISLSGISSKNRILDEVEVKVMGNQVLIRV